MRHAPLMRRGPRIADEAQAAQDAVAIEQYREDHWMSGHPRSGPALSVTRLVDRPADIFILVVETRGDFVEAAGLGSTFAELRPSVDLLPGRAAIAAAGEIAEAVARHPCRLQPY